MHLLFLTSPINSWCFSPGESAAWKLLGRVQSQPAHLFAVGAEERWRAGSTEVVHRPLCVPAEPPAGPPLPLRLLLWIQGILQPLLSLFHELSAVLSAFMVFARFAFRPLTCFACWVLCCNWLSCCFLSVRSPSASWIQGPCCVHHAGEEGLWANEQPDV